MKYALSLADDGCVLSATMEAFAQAESVLVDELPEGNISDYLYADGQYVYEPLPVPEEKPTQLDIIEAQVAYTAMMTDTLLEV